MPSGLTSLQSHSNNSAHIFAILWPLLPFTGLYNHGQLPSPKVSSILRISKCCHTLLLQMFTVKESLEGVVWTTTSPQPRLLSSCMETSHSGPQSHLTLWHHPEPSSSQAAPWRNGLFTNADTQTSRLTTSLVEVIPPLCCLPPLLLEIALLLESDQQTQLGMPVSTAIPTHRSLRSQSSTGFYAEVKNGLEERRWGRERCQKTYIHIHSYSQ